VITRAIETTYEIDTVKLDGSGLKQITPTGWISTSATELVTAGERDRLLGSRPDRRLPQLDLGRPFRRHRPAAAPDRRPMWRPIADPDHRLLQPVWSPDGQKIAFGRNADDEQRDLYTVNADGSGLFQVTHTTEHQRVQRRLGDPPADAVGRSQRRAAAGFSARRRSPVALRPCARGSLLGL
jgi:hypothetical protein